MHLPILLAAVVVTVFLLNPTAASDDSFVYAGCSVTKYTPSSTPYQTNLNAVLTSILNAAAYSSFNNFTAGGVHGLFQCRPDLPSSSCAACVSGAVTQLSTVCGGSVAATIQLDGCLVRYDNVSFFGVQDKTLAARKCGSPDGGDSDELTRRDSVLSQLASGTGLFRVGGDGDVRAVAECVGDLNDEQCKDCLGEAIGRLKMDCGSARWGDVFLTKCYARYSIHAPSRNGSTNDDETQKTLAIIVGLIAVVALIILFAAFLRKICEDKDGKS